MNKKYEGYLGCRKVSDDMNAVTSKHAEGISVFELIFTEFVHCDFSYAVKKKIFSQKRIIRTNKNLVFSDFMRTQFS